MAEVAPVALEELHRRRVVQVDVLAVRKDELDVAERVAWPRPLADSCIAGQDGVQHPRGQRLDDAALRGHELEAFAIEVTGVAPQAWHHFAASDGRRHIPVRLELDVAHLLFDQRGARVHRLADDDLHRRAHEDPVALHLVGAQHELRNVDDDHARPLQQRCPAQALEREHDLARTRRRRHLQLRQRRLADDAVGGQAVATLERGDRVNHRAVVGRRQRGIRRQVTERDQALAQPLQPGVGLAGLQLRRAPASCRRQRRQRRVPCGIVDQRAVGRESKAQLLVLGKARSRVFRRLAQAATEPSAPAGRQRNRKDFVGVRCGRTAAAVRRCVRRAHPPGNAPSRRSTSVRAGQSWRHRAAPAPRAPSRARGHPRRSPSVPARDRRTRPGFPPPPAPTRSAGHRRTMPVARLPGPRRRATPRRASRTARQTRSAGLLQYAACPHC